MVIGNLRYKCCFQGFRALQSAVRAARHPLLRRAEWAVRADELQRPRHPGGRVRVQPGRGLCGRQVCAVIDQLVFMQYLQVFILDIGHF